MSEELIKTLNRRIDELNGEVGTLRAESKDRRQKGSGLRRELDELTKAHGRLTADRDSWKLKAEASEPELRARVEELAGVIRSGKHDAAFAEAATRAGIDPGTPRGKQALADLRTLSGYKAEADEPDAAAIDAAIAGAREARPYLFGPAEPAAPAAPARLVVPPQGGGGRGGENDLALFRVRNADLSDPAFMEKNGPRIAEHSKAGTLSFVD